MPDSVTPAPASTPEPVVPAAEVTPADSGTPGGDAAETPFVLPDDFADRVKGWELDDLAKADEFIALGKALQTDEGVIDGFIQLGQQLGLGIKDLEKLFAEGDTTPPAPPVTPAEPVDRDRLLTYGEVEDLLKEQIIEPQRQAEAARQAAEAERRQTQVFETIDNWFATNKVPEDDQLVIASIGDKLIPAGADPSDPKVIAVALERGKAQYDAVIEKQAQAYIARKVAAGEALPTTLTGGAPPGGVEEDKTDYVAAGSKAMDVAKERVRAKLRAAGELT